MFLRTDWFRRTRFQSASPAPLSLPRAASDTWRADSTAARVHGCEVAHTSSRSGPVSSRPVHGCGLLVDACVRRGSRLAMVRLQRGSVYHTLSDSCLVRAEITVRDLGTSDLAGEVKVTAALTQLLICKSSPQSSDRFLPQLFPRTFERLLAGRRRGMAYRARAGLSRPE
jgi:hypothetical protein